MQTPVSMDIRENKAYVEAVCADCVDIIRQEVHFGKEQKTEGLLVFVEVTASNVLLQESVMGRLFARLDGLAPGELAAVLEENRMGVSRSKQLATMEDAMAGMLTGDMVLFVDGYDKAIQLADKGYPGKPVGNCEAEKVIRGSSEGFTDSVKINEALVRKRIRSTGMKAVELRKGIRSNTTVAILYMEELVDPSFLKQLQDGLEKYVIDGIFDGGTLEQLLEKDWMSPFPQFQSTQRPDRTAMELLDGRVAVICDNSPTALLFPAGFSSYLRVSEDRYNRFELVTFERLLRYGAMLAALLISGLYLSVINFHTQILPTPLLLSLAEARSGVPFPALIEVLIMEISFEMIREAGVRMPGPLSGTIGIVGGLIIGDAAVSANLVSPMSVIVVAFSALSSFAVPDEELSAALRLVKYLFILLGGFLGLAGIAGGLYLMGLHLCGLESFGVPYLRIGKPKTLDKIDLIWRAPIRYLRYRPYYVPRDQAVRLRENSGKAEETKMNVKKTRTVRKSNQGGRA